MQIEPYEEHQHRLVWDEFINNCPMATFLHSRQYLAYHGARFQDKSVVLKNKNNQLVALFPAAVDPKDATRIQSHPGITYGGWLHKGYLSGETMIEAFKCLASYYLDLGFTSLRYKPVPSIYHLQPSEDDLYALFRLSAHRYRCDSSTAVNLQQPFSPNNNRKRNLKRALQHVYSLDDHGSLDEFWPILTQNLMQRHLASPTHHLEEMRQLAHTFPNQIHLTLLKYQDETVAGVILYSTRTVDHAQYIAATDIGFQIGALDIIFNALISRAQINKKLFFDFGISNENEGQMLNTGLHQFKQSFGGGTSCHECYDWHFGGHS